MKCVLGTLYETSQKQIGEDTEIYQSRIRKLVVLFVFTMGRKIIKISLFIWGEGLTSHLDTVDNVLDLS